MLYTSYVRTVDLTPPVFTGTTRRTSFTNFTVAATLDKAGTVYAAVVPAKLAASVNRTVACPPAFVGDAVLAQQQLDTGDQDLTVGFEFVSGVKSATGYAVYLLARDAKGNCQPEFTQLTVHTDDDTAPVTEDVQVGCRCCPCSATVQGRRAPGS